MTIFDFFGIWKKKEEEAPANALLAWISALTNKKPITPTVSVTPTTGVWSVAPTPVTPKIDFFTPKTKVTSVPQTSNVWVWSIQIDMPKIDFLWKKSEEKPTYDYQWFIWWLQQQWEKIVRGMVNKTAEHFLRKMSVTEDMTEMVPEKYKWVVREYFQNKFPDTTYRKLQQKDTELLNNPQFKSKFNKGIVTALKEKDWNTLSNPQFRWEVIWQWLWWSLPSIAIAIATKNPQIATMAFFPRMEQEAYEDIDTDKDTSGLSEWVKEWYAMTVGALNTAIEWIWLNFLTKPFLRAIKKDIIGEVLKSPLKAWIKAMALWSEGIEEVMQQLTSDLMAKIFGSKRNLPSFEEIWNIFLAAEIWAWPIKTIWWITEFNTQSNINEQILSKPVEWGERFQEQLPQAVIDWIKNEKWLSAQDIMSKYPDIQLKRDVPVTDIYGNKSVIDAGEALTPYEIKWNKILLQDWETYIISKNQRQNIKWQSILWEWKEFAPELKWTEETVKWWKDIVQSIEMWDEQAYDKLPQNIKDIIEEEDPEWDYDKLKKLKEKLNKEWWDIEYDLDWEITSMSKVSEWEPTKYSQYTLPWWENYKEVLIKAPWEKRVVPEAKWNEEFEWVQWGSEVWWIKYGILKQDGRYYISEWNDVINNSVGEANSLEQAKLIVQQRINWTIPEIKWFKWSHRDEQNILVHLRLNERTYNWKKVTFMEELQSDRAREARKQWVIDNKPLNRYVWEDWNISTTRNGRLFWIDKEWDWYYVYEKDGQLWMKTDSIENGKKIIESTIQEKWIPWHPLLSNRQELAVKRALQEAVANWSEYFAWINGEQTANRYNLSKSVDRIWWNTDWNWGKIIDIITPNWIISSKIDTNWILIEWWSNERKWKNIADIIGKWIAERIMKQNRGVLEWEWLNIWWERAYNLYDKQVTKIVENLTGKKPEKIYLWLSDKSTKEFSIYDKEQWLTRKLDTKDIVKWNRILINNNPYVVVSKLDGNKFKAVDAVIWDWESHWWQIFENATVIYDMNIGKWQTQRSILLTPDAVARIKWESSLTKKPSGKLPFEETTPSLLEMKFQEEEATKQEEIRRTTDEDIAKAKVLLPEATYKTIEQIVNPKTGLPAYGSYLDWMIKFAKDIKKTTALHEVFHGYFDMFTDQKTQREILEIVKREQWLKTDLDAEERLAEKFAENAINLEQWKNTKWNYKILDFLDELRAKVKEIFGQWDKIKQLYNDIMEGKRPERAKQFEWMDVKQLLQAKREIIDGIKEMDLSSEKFQEQNQENIDKIDDIFWKLQESSEKVKSFENMTFWEMQDYKWTRKYKRLEDYEKDAFDRIFYDKMFPETDISWQNMNFKKTTEQYTIEERKKRSIIGWAMVNNRTKGKDVAEIVNYNKLWEIRKNDWEWQKEWRRFSPEVYEKNIGKNDKENKKILSSANKSFWEKLWWFFWWIWSMVESATKSGREILEDIHPQLVWEYYMYSEFVNTTTQRFLSEIKDDIVAINKMEKKSPTDFMKFFFARWNWDIETQTEIWNRYWIDVKKIREINGKIREIAIEQWMDVPRREWHNPMWLKNKEKFDEIIKKRWIGNYIEEFMNLSDPVKNRKLVESIYDMLDKLNKKTWNLTNITDVEITLDKISEWFTETNKDVIIWIKKFIRDSIERGDIEWNFWKTVWKTIEFMKDSVASVLEWDVEWSNAKIFNYIKGISQEWIWGLEYWSMKRREIDFYDKELLSVYHKPQDILVRYIAGMIESVGKARYLWGVADDVSLLVNDYATRKAIELNLDDKAREKLVDILTARFSYNKYWKTPWERIKLEAVRIIKNLWYVTGMSSLASSLSQFEDVSVSVIENWVSQTLKQYWKSIAWKSKISAIKMWYGWIGPEFAKSGIAKADVSFFLKINGFQWTDMRGKEAYLNSLFQNMVNTMQWENTKKQEKLRSEFDKFMWYFWKETIDKTMRVLKEWKINDIVSGYLRLKISWVQPSDQMDMPIWMMKNPQLAFFWQFKTFLTKRLQYMYRNGIREIVRAKWFKAKSKATYRFSRMLMIMMICGWITDELKDFILFRKSSSILWRLIEWEDITPAMLDKLTTNLLKFIGIGKYNIYQAKTEWIDNVVQGIFFSMPALQIPANMIMDLTDISTDGFDIEKIRTLNNVPTVGKHMYRWFGRWYASQQKTLEKERKGFWDRSGWF